MTTHRLLTIGLTCLRSLASLFIVGILTAYTAVAEVVVNEVHFSTLSSTNEYVSKQWIELFAKGSSADLSGMRILNGNGQSGYRLPSVLLPANSYLVILFADSAGRADDLTFADDGRGLIYAGERNFFSPTADSFGLYRRDGALTQYAAWSANGAVPNSSQYHAAVSTGLWPQDRVIDLTEHRIVWPHGMAHALIPGMSIGLNRLSQSKSLSDGATEGDPSVWGFHGGNDSLDSTPGRRNLSRYKLEEDYRNHNPPRRERGLLLFMQASNDLAYQFVEFLISLQRNLNTLTDYDPMKMHVVVILDTSSIFHQEIPAGDDASYGGAWHFSMEPNGETSSVPQIRMVTYLHRAFLGSPHPNTPEDPNTGDPRRLHSLIHTVKALYPTASGKWDLMMYGHGGQWKQFGPDVIDESGSVTDGLTITEMQQGLSAPFDSITLLSCLMGGLEVAYELRYNSPLLIASQEIAWTASFSEIPATITERLRAGYEPSQTKTCNETLAAIERGIDPASSLADKPRTLACVDTKKLDTLVQSFAELMDTLTPGLDDFQEHATVDDNVNKLMWHAGLAATPMRNPDLVDFGDLLFEIHRSSIPSVYTSLVPAVQSALQKAIVGFYTNARSGYSGLSIYFPRTRDGHMHSGPETSFSLYQTYATFDGVSNEYQLRYGNNYSRLPIKAEERSILDALPVLPLNAPHQHPHAFERAFHFPEDSGWAQFLERLFVPTADLMIVRGITPTGEVIFPTRQKRWEDGRYNYVDQISGPSGMRVEFAGAGSHDADSHFVLPDDGIERAYFDFDNTQRGCSRCTRYQDERDLRDAEEDIDADQIDELNDEAEASIEARTNPNLLISKIFERPGTKVVNMYLIDASYSYRWNGLVKGYDYNFTNVDGHYAEVTILEAATPTPTPTPTRTPNSSTGGPTTPTGPGVPTVGDPVPPSGPITPGSIAGSSPTAITD